MHFVRSDLARIDLARSDLVRIDLARSDLVRINFARPTNAFLTENFVVSLCFAFGSTLLCQADLALAGAAAPGPATGAQELCR